MTGDRLTRADVQTTPAPRAGGVRVEAYEGLSAGAAIGQVRSVGLHPHPQRVEGYQPDVHGQVVGQEPAGGEILPAGGIVRLLIAAPAREMPAAEEPQPEVARVEQAAVAVPEPSRPTVTAAAGREWIDELQAQPSQHGGETDTHVQARRPARRRSRSWWRRLPMAVRVTAVALSGFILLAIAVSLADHSTPARRPAASHVRSAKPARVAADRVRPARRRAHRHRTPAAVVRSQVRATAPAPARPQPAAPDVDQEPGTTSPATTPPPPPAEAAPPITPAERMEIEFGVR